MERFVHRVVLFAIILLVVNAQVMFGTDRYHAPNLTGGDIRVTATSPQRGITRMQFTDPQLSHEEIVVGDERFTDVWIEGESHTTQSGLPALPIVNRLIGIPDQGAVQLRVLAAEYTELPGYQIYPFQTMEDPSDIEGGSAGSPFRWNRDFYRQGTWYPEEIATLGEPAVFRDVRLAMVSVCPVQYNPVTGMVRVYQNIDVTIEPAPGSGINEKTRTFAHPSSLFMPMYRELENFQYLGLDEVESLPGSYLIICANNATVIGYAQQIADWKKRKGIAVKVATRAETGDSYTQIKSYILNAYNTYDPPLEFVLLMGDDTGNASDPYHVPSSGGTGGSDHPYTQVAGSDVLGDIAIGRLSAENSTSMNLLVTKILRYDQQPFTSGPDWFSKAYLLAGTSSGVSSNISTMEYIRHQMWEKGMTDVLLQTHSGTLSSSQVQPPLNQGRSFFLWRGAYIGEMSSSIMSGISNGWMMPFVFVITCGTGNFAGAGAGLSEAWVRYGSTNNGGGAVVCVGTATTGTHTRFNNIIASGIGHGFFVTQTTEAGLALMEAKLQLYRSYYPQNSYEVQAFSEWNNLMGDPGLKIWTSTPQEFQLIYPSEIPLGSNRVPILIRNNFGDPVEGALVCLMKGEETWSRQVTGASGYLEMTVDPETVGTLWLTASKTNYLTRTADIAVVQQDFWVGYSDAVIDDDNIGGTQGNGDSQLNPGETVDIMITAKNYGTSLTATDVVGTLFSFDNSIAQIIHGELPYPNIAPGMEVQSQGAYRVIISPSAQDQDVTPILLQFDAAQGMDTSLTPLVVVSGRAQYQSYRFLVSNNRLDPGETEHLIVSIKNTGHRTVSNVQGQIFTSDTLITFPEPIASYGTITMGGNSTNNGDPFYVTANPLTIPGHPVTLGVAYSGDGGFADTVFFDITVGNPGSTQPVGPDDYGYYCFDNTDVSYAIAPTYTWLEIDPGHGGSGHLLPIYDNYENGDDAALIPMPFPFQMYGVDYDSITVCSNGWAALGDQHRHVDFRNHPIPGAQGPDAMLAAFWDDLVVGNGHVYWDYLESNGLMVIEWSGVRTLSGSYTETFEIVLYDPEVYPTRSGDGMIKFQYLNVTNAIGSYDDNDYCTVGIEDHTQMDGLQISYWNNYASAAAALSANRAYLFVTGFDYGAGNFQGQVTDLETAAPLANALVSVDNGEYWDSTNAQGNFSISDLVIGPHSVMCSKTGYNTTETTINITRNQTTQRNFQLAHPEFILDVTNVQEQLAQGTTTTRTIHLENLGNGDLVYQAALEVPSAAVTMVNHASGSTGRTAIGPVRHFSGTDEPWDQVLAFNATTSTNDHLMQGVAYAYGKFWVTGGGTTASSPNYLYQFDSQGNYLSSVPQPTTSQYGFRDLAWDGQYLWGSDSKYLVAMDATGAVMDSIEAVLSPNRALAYDSDEDVFYTGNITAPIVAVNRLGNEIRRYANHNLTIYGLAWFKHDPDLYPLYLFCQEGDQTRLQVNKLDPATGDIRFVADLSGAAGDLAGGAEITPSWSSQIWVFAGQIMGATSDQIGVWELAPNTGWIDVSLNQGTVQSGATGSIQVILDAREVPTGNYNLNLVFNHNAISSPDTVTVHLTVTGEGFEPQEKLTPFEYALDQNYPNPFNPMTMISYSLQAASPIKLIVYNVLGQKVATLVDQRQEAGSHQVRLDASLLASGVYFYRIEAGSFTQTRKMVLLR